MEHWKPTASLTTLQRRAECLREIREFFHQRQVMEVDTPALMADSVTDPYMDALSLTVCGHKAWLQTSPEYAMKRLLASGCGDIYQLSKNYRRDERGRFHQPEFMLLEWYRVGWDHHQLMDEVFDLVAQLTQINERENWSYQGIFQHHLGINPFAISDSELKLFSEQQLGDLPDGLFRDDYLSLLFAEKIEPELGEHSIVFVYDFPASQSSLARLMEDKPECSARFEVYSRGVELANGFFELTDAEQQEARFRHDNIKRQQMNKPEINLDAAFMAALHSGLPDCSGVALGVDRLLMIAMNQSHINKVIPFPL